MDLFGRVTLTHRASSTAESDVFRHECGIWLIRYVVTPPHLYLAPFSGLVLSQHGGTKTWVQISYL